METNTPQGKGSELTISLPKISITIGNDTHKSRGSLNLLSVGFALQLAWFFSALLNAGRPFTDPLEFVAPDAFQPAPIAVYICGGTALALFVFAAFTDRRLLKLYTSRRLIIIFALLCFAGTLANFGLSEAGAVGIMFNVVSGVLSGFGSAGLVLLWGVAFSRSGATTIVMNASVSVVAAMILNALIVRVLPFPAAGFVIAVLPLIEIPFLWARTPASFTERQAEPIFERPSIRRGRFCARCALPLLLFGLGLGALAHVVSQVIIITDDTVSLLLSLFAGGTITLFALIGIFSADKGNHWEFLFRPLIPAIIVTMAFVPSLFMTGSAFSAIAVLAGFLSFAALMWVFLGLICQEYRPSPFFVFGFGCACLVVGAAGGWYLMGFHSIIDSWMPFGAGGAIIVVIVATVIAYGLYPHVNEIARALVPDSTPVESKASQAETVEEGSEEEIGTSAPAENVPATPMPTAPGFGTPYAPQPPAFIGNPTPQVPLSGYGAYYPAAVGAAPSAAATAGTETESLEQTYLYRSTRLGVFPADPYGAAAPLPTRPDDTIPAPSAAAERQAPAPAEEHHQSRFRDQCDSIAERYLLSRREREVMQLLARGHNAAYIQEKLCISRSTAKTHITHIYRKLDIHTQQELLTMVDESK